LKTGIPSRGRRDHNKADDKVPMVDFYGTCCGNEQDWIHGGQSLRPRAPSSSVEYNYARGVFQTNNSFDMTMLSFAYSCIDDVYGIIGCDQGGGFKYEGRGQ
jgi:hypothetical protein